jgi:hypothetical protein
MMTTPTTHALAKLAVTVTFHVHGDTVRVVTRHYERLLRREVLTGAAARARYAELLKQGYAPVK